MVMILLGLTESSSSIGNVSRNSSGKKGKTEGLDHFVQDNHIPTLISKEGWRRELP